MKNLAISVSGSEKKYLRIDAAREFLGSVPRNFLYEHPEIPHSKIGKYLLWAVDDLIAWIDKNRVTV